LHDLPALAYCHGVIRGIATSTRSSPPWRSLHRRARSAPDRSRLPAWRKRPLEVEGDGINKIVLASLDTVVAKCIRRGAASTFSVPLSKSVQDRTRALEENAFEVAVGAFAREPESRRVASHRPHHPSNRVMARRGPAADTQGMGLFTQGLCHRTSATATGAARIAGRGDHAEGREGEGGPLRAP
jgi:hypothetical protein